MSNSQEYHNRWDYDYFPYTLNNSAFISLTWSNGYGALREKNNLETTLYLYIFFFFKIPFFFFHSITIQCLLFFGRKMVRIDKREFLVCYKVHYYVH